MKEIECAGAPNQLEYDPSAFTLACGKMRMLWVDCCNTKTREHEKHRLENLLGPLLVREKASSRDGILDLIFTYRRARTVASTGALYWIRDRVASSRS